MAVPGSARRQAEDHGSNITDMDKVPLHSAFVIEREGGATDQGIFQFAENRKPIAPAIGVEHPQNLVLNAIGGAKLGHQFFIQVLGNTVDRDRAAQAVLAGTHVLAIDCATADQYKAFQPVPAARLQQGGG